ncbi:MAG: hypothetical protein GY803_14400 [Chloroflexi bacterium]|nr:hypothetical protein [Chloroflexota bacterium]
MKHNYREIILGTVLFTFFLGIIVWFVLVKPQSPLPIGIAILTLLIGVIAFARQTISKRAVNENGVPAPVEDEFTKLAKVYAGNQAFLYSIYLWLLIFVFNSSFAKNETMLGMGILGSALIYGISLWYFKTTGGFDA